MKIFNFEYSDKFDFINRFNYWSLPPPFIKKPFYCTSIIFVRSASIEKYYYIEIVLPEELLYSYDIYTGEVDNDIL